MTKSLKAADERTVNELMKRLGERWRIVDSNNTTQGNENTGEYASKSLLTIGVRQATNGT